LPLEQVRRGGRHLWGQGYFIATSGNMTDEVILEYINNQDAAESDDEFTITE
jgi:putative transposase